MSDASLETLLNDLCISGLIRLLRRRSEEVLTYSPRLSVRDMTALRARWALSDSVQSLAAHVSRHPRSISTTLNEEESLSEGAISGAIDARASVFRQLVSCDPALFVNLDPIESALSGPNHIVAWTLRAAEESVLPLLRSLPDGVSAEAIHDRAALIERALRVDVLNEIAISPLGRLRPGLSAVRAASKARNKLYRLALDAFQLLNAVANLDREALVRLFQETLLASLENWQKLELAAAVSAADALSQAMKVDVVLGLTPGQKEPVAEVGPFEIWWQRALPERDDALLDESERMARALANHVGIGLSASRADVVVTQASTGRIVSIFECKWFKTEASLAGAVLDASNQLVRYVRDASEADAAASASLLATSWLIVAAKEPLTTKCGRAEVIRFTDVVGLAGSDLQDWARSLAHSIA